MNPTAVVKASYRFGSGSAASSRASVDYQVHRPDADTEIQIAQGLMPPILTERSGFDYRQDNLSYQDMVGRTQSEHNYHYHLILSPHPDHSRHMDESDLKDWTRRVMLVLEERHPRMDWTAVIHADPQHPHVHVMAYVGDRLDSKDDFAPMREKGSEVSQEIAAPWLELSREAPVHEPQPPSGGQETEDEEGGPGAKKKVKALELGY